MRFAFSIGLVSIVLCPPHCPARCKDSLYRSRQPEKSSGLILIHGLADDASMWDSVIPALSTKFRVIALDQIGFGRSDKPLLNYRVCTFVDFLDGFMTELKIDRASLVGNSLGGWVAAAFVLAHPERIESLVLCDAAGYAALAKTRAP